MKHLEHTLATYVYSHCNICNIRIYFCNIYKHLKHTFATCAFSVTSTSYLDEWRLVDTKLDAAKWRRGRGMPAGGRASAVPTASGPRAGEGCGGRAGAVPMASVPSIGEG
jgi:hypothetical protein